MAGRPKKVEVIEETTIDKVEETTVIEDKEKEELKKKNDELAEMLLKLQAQLNDVTTRMATGMSTQPTKESSLIGKKIKCINLMRNPLNVSTEPNGKGKMFEFQKYGETKLIKFDELSDIVSSYPNTMGQGLLYIANASAVEELGLSDEYENIHTKEMLDELIYLRRDMDVDVFISMPKALQESTAVEIARLINANEAIDWNRQKKIKDATGINFEEIAKAIIVESEVQNQK